MADFSDAISGIESGGNYGLLGPVTRSGDRAYGKYQVMGANIPQWTSEVLGAPMSPKDFLANPQAQDAVFQAKFGQYAQKYGPEGAARAWFAGEGGMNNSNAKDQLGTSVQQYGQRFMAGLGGPPLSGPQQSYANRSESAMPAGPGGGPSGQALQQTSSYNNSPYSSGPQGTIGNTGAPLAQSGSQVVSQGGRGLDQYQSTPSWTGSPLSQSPPARDEGSFQAPPLNGPTPLRQRQQVQAMVEALRQHFANLPKPYHFKLG